MNLKHIEELANDKDLVRAWFVSYMKDWDIEDYGAKTWDKLTAKQKKFLIERAIYYWTKGGYYDESNAPIPAICDCVMSWQKDILNGKMDECEFWEEVGFFY